MNLGQTILVVLSITMLGVLMLGSNNTILMSSSVQSESEFGITAVSLATSIVEEAMGKMFDAVVADTNNTLQDSLLLTSPGSLGHSGSESYRGSGSGTTDFNDFDDYNNLFLVYKSSNPRDTARTSGSDYEIIVPGIRSKYFVKCKVRYVRHTDLNTPVNYPTWHKRLEVTVTRPLLHIGPPAQQVRDSIASTLVFPAVMSFWN